MAILKEGFTDLRAHIESLPIIGRRITVLRLLDFTDEAIAALDSVAHCEGALPCCRDHSALVLAKLDEEQR